MDMKIRNYRDEIIFDARLLMDKRRHKGKKLLRMVRGPITYTTWNGVKFYQDHPFQLVLEDEAIRLLELPAYGNVKFAQASIAQVEDYYVN